MKHLGNLAVVAERSIRFECQPCQVSWQGCAAAFTCPLCGRDYDWTTTDELVNFVSSASRGSRRCSSNRGNYRTCDSSGSCVCRVHINTNLSVSCTGK